ncbi:MAG: C69 family dipeptidase [Acidobacteriota bacterium]
MCDTLVALQNHTNDHSVWFAKNSDREPGEAQAIEHHPQTNHASTRKLQCTYIEIPAAEKTNEVLISRPVWMWGAEFGANEYGVTIGNEAVWTKIPTEKIGLTGMDLLRLAIERTVTAREALELITDFIQRYNQGGACGFRNKNFRYHNSFIIADPQEAWVLETAGKFWAAEKVKGIRTISNCLSIGKAFDLIADGAFSYAKQKGWCKSTADFDFAKCFGDPIYRKLSGGVERSSCTFRNLSSVNGLLRREDFFATLRNHNGRAPQNGWRMRMPCAHASIQPTRRAGQTTSSIVSCLNPSQNLHWLTGTSSPCLSVFKPMRLRQGIIQTGKPPQISYDTDSLFWRHERLHRLVLRDYENLKPVFDDARLALEASFTTLPAQAFTPEICAKTWQQHFDNLNDWINQIEKAGIKKQRLSMFQRYWAQQEKLDGMPAT